MGTLIAIHLVKRGEKDRASAGIGYSAGNAGEYAQSSIEIERMSTTIYLFAAYVLIHRVGFRTGLFGRGGDPIDQTGLFSPRFRAIYFVAQGGKRLDLVDSSADAEYENCLFPSGRLGSPPDSLPNVH